MITSRPICVAIDTPDLDRALALARAVAPYAGHVKLGMEFFYAHGRRGYEAVAAVGLPVFLDLKLHDIPNTVASALAALMRLEPRPAIVNVHAAGGRAMMLAAAEAVAGRAKLVAVTILTSLSDADVETIGFDRRRAPGEHAVALARLAKESELDGVVCSAREVAAIKAATARDFLAVVPGIRLDTGAPDDQRRTSTPAAALAAGADLLVIGRAITGAADPAAALRSVAEALHAG